MLFGLCLLFAAASPSPPKECSGIDALIEIGFEEAIRNDPAVVGICPGRAAPVQSCVNEAVFTTTFNAFSKNFTEIYSKNLKNLARNGHSIYKQGAQVIQTILDDHNYNRLLELKKSLIPFADDKSLKEQAHALEKDKSCLDAQLATLLHVWCILSGTDASAVLKKPAKKVLEVKGSLIEEAVRSCRANLELICDFENVWAFSDDNPEKGALKTVAAENCSKFWAWRGCVDAGKSCEKGYERVFEAFFSPTKLLITNGMKEEFALRQGTAVAVAEDGQQWKYAVSKTGLAFLKDLLLFKSAQIAFTFLICALSFV